MRTPKLIVLIALVTLTTSLGSTEAGAQGSDRSTYSAHVGAGGAKAWNFVGLTAEFFPAGEHFSIFATAGLGTILVGGGAALYTRRSAHGFFATATAGLAGAHVQAGGQLRLSERVFATAGVGAGHYFLQHAGVLPFAAVEYRW